MFFVSTSYYFKMLGDGSKVGNYRLGCKVGNSPVKCISNYIARKDGTQEFFVVKVSHCTI